MRKLSTRRRGARWRVCRAVFVLASITGVAAFTGAPSRTATRSFPLWERAEVQVLAPTLDVRLSASSSFAPSDSWRIKLAWGPADSELFELSRTEHEIATISGTGPFVPAIPISPEWRWDLLPLPYAGLRVYTTLVSGGGSQTIMNEVELIARDGTRQYNPHVPRKFGGGWAGFPSGSALMVPPDAGYAALGALVRSGTKPATFAIGSRPRTRAAVPFKVPPRDAKRVTADVTYVPRVGAESVVYHGAATIPSALAPGARVSVPTRLTPTGVQLARRLGARRLAAALKSAGYIFFTSSGGLAHGDDTAPEMIEVPMSSCYRSLQAEPKHPCSQTCPHFPDVQAAGYLVYTVLGDVFGSTTCTRGAPLVPWPMY